MVPVALAIGCGGTTTATGKMVDVGSGASGDAMVGTNGGAAGNTGGDNTGAGGTKAVGSGGTIVRASGGVSGSPGFGGVMARGSGGADASTCLCTVSECPPGTESVKALGQCCPTCVPCGNVVCQSPPVCPSGEVVVARPGQCCPSWCKSIADLSCDELHAAWLAFKDARGYCSTKSDCSSFVQYVGTEDWCSGPLGLHAAMNGPSGDAVPYASRYFALACPWTDFVKGTGIDVPDCVLGICADEYFFCDSTPPVDAGVVTRDAAPEGGD